MLYTYVDVCIYIYIGAIRKFLGVKGACMTPMMPIKKDANNKFWQSLRSWHSGSQADAYIYIHSYLSNPNAKPKAKLHRKNGFYIYTYRRAHKSTNKAKRGFVGWIE